MDTAEDILENIEKVEYFVGSEGKDTLLNLFYAYLVTGDEALLNSLKSLLSIYLPELVEYGDFLPLPSEDVVSGDIELGDLRFGEASLFPVKLKMEYLFQTLIVGKTGMGKTTLMLNLIENLLAQKLNLWIFDLKKDYRAICRVHPELVVLPLNRLRFNPLQNPSNVHPKRWLQIHTAIFAYSHAILSGGKDWLMNVTNELYESKGVYSGSNSYPTLADITTALNQMKMPLSTRFARYQEVLIDRLNATIISLSNTIDCKKGFVEALVDRSVVFEIDDVDRDISTYLILALLFWLYTYRKAKGERGRIKNVIICDEARNIFDRSKERIPEIGFPLIDEIISRGREFGILIIAADQEPQKISSSLLANT